MVKFYCMSTFLLHTYCQNFAFCFLHTAILPKSTNTKHIKENIEVFSFSLTTEDMTKLDNLNKDTHFCWNPEEVA
jgi:diketogulonate reductase-like aldo/keto reductase